MIKRDELGAGFFIIKSMASHKSGLSRNVETTQLTPFPTNYPLHPGVCIQIRYHAVIYPKPYKNKR